MRAIFTKKKNHLNSSIKVNMTIKCLFNLLKLFELNKRLKNLSKRIQILNFKNFLLFSSNNDPDY